MAAEPTIRDALIAEMLGDIGKLHDAVLSLNETLPREVDAAEERITGLIGLLQKAGDAYRDEVKKHTQTQFENVRDQIDTDANNARRRITADAAASKRELDEAIKRVLSEIPKVIRTSMDSAISKPVQQVAASLQHSAWKNLVLCFASSVVGAAMVLIATVLLK